jgi:hypothetical protein
MSDTIPRSQHVPFGIQLTSVITPNEIPFRGRYNLKKANWPEYTKMTEEMVKIYRQLQIITQTLSR